ncbi:MAG: hypothetical protein LBC53_08410 [Spirochaetaceae bacterium]|jgi:hypothetical protein|nr:hypothetical protein [Spirochaetaceae bacterium]
MRPDIKKLLIEVRRATTGGQTEWARRVRELRDEEGCRIDMKTVLKHRAQKPIQNIGKQK